MRMTSFYLALSAVFSFLFLPQHLFSQQEESNSSDSIPHIIINVPDTARGFIMASREPAPLNMDSVAQVIGYPQKAVRKGIQGQVIVRILVDESGQYVRHRILRPIDPILVAAIEPELQHLRFSPALDTSGNPLKFWVNIPFNFSLR